MVDERSWEEKMKKNGREGRDIEGDEKGKRKKHRMKQGRGGGGGR